MTTSALILVSPSGEKITFPPDFLTAFLIPANIDSPFGNSSLVCPVPCQERVQPPQALEILSAPSPTTRMVLLASRGSVCLLFFNKTMDSRTACLAIALFSGRARRLVLPALGLVLGAP